MFSQQTLDMYNNITKEEILKSNLSFASFFIAFYEAAKDDICQSIKLLYGIDSEQFEKGTLTCDITQKYKEDILDIIPTGCKKANTFFASLCWLKDGGALTEEEYSFIQNDVQNLRNDYAHRLMDQLFRNVAQEDFETLKRFLNIYKKIKTWWATEMDGFPENSENVFVIWVDYIFDTLFGDKK